MNELRNEDSELAALCSELRDIEAALNGVLVGQTELVRQVVVGIFAGGHLLLEGLPGLGKTHLAKALANVLGLELARIQCTPDLMPADITGSDVLVRDAHDNPRMEFQRGALFAPMVLVDEINRATPKTQSALLEAMQEHQVTYGGQRYPLPEPFWVLATQNPIELEGTYPLPEAQLDRFLFKLNVGYPSAEALQAMLEVSLDDEPSEHLAAITTPARVAQIIEQAKNVIIAGALREAAVELILATHPARERVSNAVRRHIRYGASPRGLQALLRAARVNALLEQRAHVAPRDLATVALATLRHRVLLNLSSEMDGVEIDALVSEIIARWSDTLA